ncbi:hypothetical protein DXT68_04365 [Microbacterium foliorum]|uniref:Uncharacterized protein n=1 Tax=Microbacterium foliorum TaxID=104336 RepID=A0A0F0KRY4_9MICO|nr:hypothetical protein [Microbacterium foliorum]AXL11451.1 hypothetical protein DXT68_04365 [Microbacterium foliorum]KJL23643.1 hypothetical protein RN50_00981 [Microbacterium foliorum]
MPHESDAAELRALQARAYGRGGGLSDTDAARLAALESARVVRTAGDAGDAGDPVPLDDAISAVDPTLDGDAVPAAGAATPAGDAIPDDAATPGDTATPAAPADTVPPAGSRRRWTSLVAASAALLLVGLGVGWAVFAEKGDGISLTAAQQERRAALQDDGGYDPGSLRAIGQDDDALVWLATKDDGELSCLTLDVAAESSTQCAPTEDLERGWGFGVSVVTPAGDDDEPAQQLSATAARATTGEFVAVVQRWDTSGNDWMSQFEGAERDRAEQLADEGFDEYTYSIVGDFQEQPVWFGQRTTGAVTEDCLVVDALDATQCVRAGESREAGIGIRTVTFDEGAGRTVTSDVLLSFTRSGTPYLVVSDDAPASASGTDAG